VLVKQRAVMAAERRLPVGKSGRVEPLGLCGRGSAQRVRIRLGDELQDPATIEWDVDTGELPHGAEVRRIVIARRERCVAHLRWKLFHGGGEHSGCGTRGCAGPRCVEHDHTQIVPRRFERDGEPGDPASDDEDVGRVAHEKVRRLAARGLMCAISLPGTACSRAMARWR